MRVCKQSNTEFKRQSAKDHRKCGEPVLKSRSGPREREVGAGSSSGSGGGGCAVCLCGRVLS